MLQFGKLEKGRGGGGVLQNYTSLKFVLMNERGSVERQLLKRPLCPVVQVCGNMIQPSRASCNFMVQHAKPEPESLENTDFPMEKPAGGLHSVYAGFGWRHYSYIAFLFFFFFSLLFFVGRVTL